MRLGDRLWHKRLRDFESFDRITFEVKPRYKTSGLSGDEWRQHVEVTFWFKGEAVHHVGYRDMQAALMLAPGEWIRAQEPIPERVIELEKDACDQPSCPKKAVGRFKLKRETARQGEWIETPDGFEHYRKFCAQHIRRGDSSREDCDENYEPMDGVGPDSSTNLEESPAVLAPPIIVTGVDE